MPINNRKVQIFLYIEISISEEMHLGLRAKSGSWAGLWYLYPSKGLTINFPVPHLWNRVILLPCTPEVLWQCIKKIERYSYSRAMKATHLLKIAHWLTTTRKEIHYEQRTRPLASHQLPWKVQIRQGPQEIPYHVTCPPPRSTGSSVPSFLQDENHPAA